MNAPEKLQPTDGGPAFPQQSTQFNDGKGDCLLVGSTGMSLRDWFAGLASDDDVEWASDQIGVFCTRQQARYFHADMMLKARAEK